ncbi:Uncharacterised protein [Bordetella pertussis]|nr:Uncharacterised protein [Bordetella pertussis]
MLVAGVQVVVLGGPGQFGHEGAQRLVAAPGAALRAVGLEAGRIDAHRHAGVAIVAMGPVGEQAAAAKALFHQLRVRAGVDQVPGRRHLRTRLPAWQVAAGVGGSGIKLQRGEGEFF